MQNIAINGITVAKAGFTASVVLLGTLVTSGGCEKEGVETPNIVALPPDPQPAMDMATIVDPPESVVNGDYDRVLPAVQGLSIILKRHATNGMVTAFVVCRNAGDSESFCGIATLDLARRIVEMKLKGDALELWKGNYPVWGYRPNIAYSFRNEEGAGFAKAVQGLLTRSDECLRINWTPTGATWTSVGEEANTDKKECDWGKTL